jgi:hypothetical protein
MDENNTHRAEYRPAPDFYPYDHANAIKGISECLHDLFTEGEAVDMRHSNELRASINGLVWIQQKLVRELHEWLVNIENLTTIELPMTAEDFERHHVRKQHHDGVKDEAAIYAVK